MNPRRQVFVQFDGRPRAVVVDRESIEKLMKWLRKLQTTVCGEQLYVTTMGRVMKENEKVMDLVVSLVVDGRNIQMIIWLQGGSGTWEKQRKEKNKRPGR